MLVIEVEKSSHFSIVFNQTNDRKIKILNQECSFKFSHTFETESESSKFNVCPLIQTMGWTQLNKAFSSHAYVLGFSRNKSQMGALTS